MNEHTHVDGQGVMHKCYHNCKNVLTDYAFWIGMTIGFPIEHFLWGHIYDLLGWGH